MQHSSAFLQTVGYLVYCGETLLTETYIDQKEVKYVFDGAVKLYYIF